MSELFHVEVIAKTELEKPANETFGLSKDWKDYLTAAAKVGKLGLKGKVKGSLADWPKIIKAAQALDADKLAAALPAASKTYQGYARDCQAWARDRILHVAHPEKFPAAPAFRTELKVRSIHPDAGMPKESELARATRLAFEILALYDHDAHKTNALLDRFGPVGKLLGTPEDDIHATLWDVRLSDRKALAGKPNYHEALVRIWSRGSWVAHVNVGDAFESAPAA